MENLFIRNSNSSESEVESDLATEKSYSLIMVKPHARKQVLDPIIEDILSGNFEKYTFDKNMNIASTDLEFLKSVFSKTKLIGKFYRDLTDERYKPLLDVFYGKEKNKKYYKTLIEEYTGPCLFLLLNSDSSTDELYKAIKIIRGYQVILNEDNSVKIPGSGIRGFLTFPNKYLSEEELTEERLRNIIRNVIHTPDDPNETAKALRLIMRAGENDKDPNLIKFLNKYDPVSIV